MYVRYVSGGSIRKILTAFGPLTEAIVRVYTRQILLGLEYLHNNRAIHRDIKGANILVDTRGSVKLADFGCSKIYEDFAQTGENMSVRGVCCFEFVMVCFIYVLLLDALLDGTRGYPRHWIWKNRRYLESWCYYH